MGKNQEFLKRRHELTLLNLMNALAGAGAILEHKHEVGLKLQLNEGLHTPLPLFSI